MVAKGEQVISKIFSQLLSCNMHARLAFAHFFKFNFLVLCFQCKFGDLKEQYLKILVLHSAGHQPWISLLYYDMNFKKP